jgi:hypothetical protein
VQEESLKFTIVFLHEEEVYGEVVSEGTYASTIKYNKDGFQYVSIFLNEDFDIIQEFNIPEIEEN